MATNATTMPQFSNDRIDQMLWWMQRYYPGPQFWYIFNLTDFPIVYEQELLMHYLRGGAGPFIDFKVYTDIGIGFEPKAVGFENEEDGEEAEQIVKKAFHDLNLHATLKQYDTFYRVLGRCSIVKTLNGDGSFYSNKNAGITGFDNVNPMSLTMGSIKEVMDDTTGTAEFTQLGDKTVTFSQDRVIYNTNNNLTNRSVLGNSDLSRAITDLRTLARFPHNRNKLADLISNAYNFIKVDAKSFAEDGGPLQQAVYETKNGMQDYLTSVATTFTEQRQKGNDFAGFSWLEPTPIGWSGNEPDIGKLEMDTLQSIAYKLGVPLQLVGMNANEVNRATLETMNDVYVALSENGVRKHLFTPIIDDLSTQILATEGITEGYMKTKYNSFLSADLLELAQIIAAVWNTGAISKPDVRDMMQIPEDPDMGGDFWVDKNPLPESSAMPNQNVVNVQKKLEEMRLAKRL